MDSIHACWCFLAAISFLDVTGGCLLKPLHALVAAVATGLRWGLTQAQCQLTARPLLCSQGPFCSVSHFTAAYTHSRPLPSPPVPCSEPDSTLQPNSLGGHEQDPARPQQPQACHRPLSSRLLPGCALPQHRPWILKPFPAPL